VLPDTFKFVPIVTRPLKVPRPLEVNELFAVKVFAYSEELLIAN
jgi:hypothetical protein